MREERQSFRFLGNLVGQVCRENLGHRALVLGFVVEDGVRRDKYFTDRERGVPATVAWLCEELGELAQAVRKGTRDQQVHEFGDVLAWLASLANLWDITLDEAMGRYVTDPPL